MKNGKNDMNNKIYKFIPFIKNKIAENDDQSIEICFFLLSFVVLYFVAAPKKYKSFNNQGLWFRFIHRTFLKKLEHKVL